MIGVSDLRISFSAARVVFLRGAEMAVNRQHLRLIWTSFKKLTHQTFADRPSTHPSASGRAGAAPGDTYSRGRQGRRHTSSSCQSTNQKRKDSQL